MNTSSNDIAELRDLLEGLIRLQAWQGELLRRAALLVGGDASAPPSGLEAPARKPRRKRGRGGTDMPA